MIRALTPAIERVHRQIAKVRQNIRTVLAQTRFATAPMVGQY